MPKGVVVGLAEWKGEESACRRGGGEAGTEAQSGAGAEAERRKTRWSKAVEKESCKDREPGCPGTKRGSHSGTRSRETRANRQGRSSTLAHWQNGLYSGRNFGRVPIGGEGVKQLEGEGKGKREVGMLACWPGREVWDCV